MYHMSTQWYACVTPPSSCYHLIIFEGPCCSLGHRGEGRGLSSVCDWDLQHRGQAGARMAQWSYLDQPSVPLQHVPCHMWGLHGSQPFHGNLLPSSNLLCHLRNHQWGLCWVDQCCPGGSPGPRQTHKCIRPAAHVSRNCLSYGTSCDWSVLLRVTTPYHVLILIQELYMTALGTMTQDSTSQAAWSSYPGPCCLLSLPCKNISQTKGRPSRLRAEKAKMIFWQKLESLNFSCSRL